MNDIAVSKLKATCLALLEDVHRTRRPIRITRFGKPIAEVIPPSAPKSQSWLGSMKDQIEINGDIVKPVGAFDDWNAR
jgi:antitoxin (DNA-binding transcriptional repressor) of toxin-antitoxin stability system